jgi:hypothetical protein
MSAGSRFLVIILVVLGVLAIAAGIIYLAEPAKSLPTFVPGYAAHVTGRHWHRGLGGIVVGVVLLLLAAITARSSRRTYQLGRGR